MSEKATLCAIREAYARPQGLFGHYGMETRAAEFDRMIAEVERAAAEKAWGRCVGEMPIDPDWKNFYADNNPYRAAALGLTAGQEGEKA